MSVRIRDRKYQKKNNRKNRFSKRENYSISWQIIIFCIRIRICIHWSSHSTKYRKCRNTKTDYDACIPKPPTQNGNCDWWTSSSVTRNITLKCIGNNRVDIKCTWKRNMKNEREKKYKIYLENSSEQTGILCLTLSVKNCNIEMMWKKIQMMWNRITNAIFETGITNDLVLSFLPVCIRVFHFSKRIRNVCQRYR